MSAGSGDARREEIVEALPDSTLSGTPLPGRPGSPEAEAANAYYMLPDGPGIEAPAVENSTVR